MKVSRSLLEKYHLNQCSAEERMAVEQWLEHAGFDDDNQDLPDDVHTVTGPESEDAVRQEIWSRLSTQTNLTTTNSNNGNPLIIPFWKTGLFRMALAATVLILIVATALNRSLEADSPAEPHASNRSALVTSSKFIVDRLPGTRATVHERGIDFCGLMRIEATQDAELTLTSTCTDSGQSETILLHEGETYLAFNHQFARNNELLVVNVNALDDLPPVIRRQFNVR